MKYGKIPQLPVQEKKRRILYEEIVKSFEPGQVYTERDVNIIIAIFDFACGNRANMLIQFPAP